jgi:predicted transcriptional regulator
MKKTMLLLACLVPLTLFAEVMKENTTLPTLTVKDQFEKELRADETTQEIIIAFSKKQGEAIKAFLEQNPTYLREHNAIYWMDATEVPSFVMSLFMMPKFKKYDYSVGIVEDKNVVASFPKKEDKITVLTLDKLKITQIAFKETL